MTCDEARLRVADELGGIRSDSEVEAHLASCPACQAETEAVRLAWSRLNDLPEPEPRPSVATRFYAALDAYQQGMQEKRSGLFKWWPSQPAWQMAVCLGCLIAGMFAGTVLMHRGGGSPASSEIAELHKEMTGMRQLVTLSLLQQQSAADRLRGVTWSYRAEPNDMEVLSALLETATIDNNVDVRLAAVDALRNFGDSPVARRGLTKALAKQDSPLVQISIIDALVELREKSAAPVLRSLLKAPDLDPNVRKRISEAFRTFE